VWCHEFIKISDCMILRRGVCGMFKGVSEGEYGCMIILDLMACLNRCGVILL